MPLPATRNTIGVWASLGRSVMTYALTASSVAASRRSAAPCGALLLASNATGAAAGAGLLSLIGTVGAPLALIPSLVGYTWRGHGGRGHDDADGVFAGQR